MIKWILLIGLVIVLTRIISMIKWVRSVKHAVPLTPPLDWFTYCWCPGGLQGVHDVKCPIVWRRGGWEFKKEDRLHAAVLELESLPPAESLTDTLFGKGF